MYPKNIVATQNIYISQGFYILFFCDHNLFPFVSICSLKINMFLIFIIFSFQECYINGRIQYVNFLKWLFFHSGYFSWDSSKWLCVLSSFVLLLSSIPRIGCTSLFNHLPAEGCLGSFWFGALTNKAAMHICAQFLMWTYISVFLG